MAGKKTKAPAPKEPKEMAESVKPEPEPPIASPKPANDLPKIVAVALLAVIVIAMAWYFLNSPATAFVPGSPVTAAAFTGVFGNSTNIDIVMDLRGVTNDTLAHNIMQCGVDFSGSSGMGGKNVSHMAFSGAGCVSDDGDHPLEYCINQLKSGTVIYVEAGQGGADYFTNGMIVSVGSNYTVGTCGIRRLS